MSLPSPEDPGRAPVWENYVIAQAVQASRGQIPQHTLAFGVEVAGRHLRLLFQLAELSEGDEVDMTEIVGEFEALVGDAIEVEFSYEVLAERRIAPADGVSWVFFARQ